MDEHVSGLTTTDEEIQETERSTRGQSANSLWFERRKTVLTASNFGKAAKTKVEPSNKVKAILYSNFYRTCIRPVAEYACQAYHNSLPAYLSDDLERIQRRALRIIYPFCSYREALTLSGLTSLKSRRESLTTRLFKEILEDPNHNLHGLLPPMNETIRSLRQKRTFSIPRCKTKRYQSSFIIANALHCKL